MKTLHKTAVYVGLLALCAVPALARADVGVSFSVGVPYGGVYVGGPPVYYAPPAYYGPAYYGGYYAPPPAYYAPSYYYGPPAIYGGYYRGGGWHHGHHRHWR